MPPALPGDTYRGPAVAVKGVRVNGRVRARNNLIHVIDRVLWPGKLTQRPGSGRPAKGPSCRSACHELPAAVALEVEERRQVAPLHPHRRLRPDPGMRAEGDAQARR